MSLIPTKDSDVELLLTFFFYFVKHIQLIAFIYIQVNLRDLFSLNTFFFKRSIIIRSYVFCSTLNLYLQGNSE